MVELIFASILLLGLVCARSRILRVFRLVPRRAAAALVGGVLVGVVLISVVVLGPEETVETVDAGTPEQPNVLLIITDDQRDGTMRVMPRTREIFGRGGTTYRHAYVTTPQCCPSRSSIYSGQYVHNHGVRSNKEATNFDTERFVFRHLKEAGYETALHGKFLNGWRGAEIPYVDDARVRDGGRTPGEKDRFRGEWASEFIATAEEAHDGEGVPWAVALALTTPHEPLVPEDRYAKARVPECKGFSNPGTREQDFSDKYRGLGRAQMVPPQRRNWRGAELCRAQLRMLKTADDVVEGVWDTVEAHDADGEETLAIFMSDNGYYWDEHQLKGKFLPYLESLAIPMYARWPGHIDAGAIEKRYTLNIDVAPTIYDAIDAMPGYRPDGRSLLDPGWKRNWLLLEGSAASSHVGWPAFKEAFFDGRRHVIHWRSGFREYYNLRRDPHELHNLLRTASSRELGKVRQHTKRLLRRLGRVADCRGPATCP